MGSLAIRIIPTVLIRNGRCIKGQQFKADRIIGSALQACRIYAFRSVDELVILNLDEKPNYEFFDAITEDCYIPVAYGGGIGSIETAQHLFTHGIDKVIVKHCEILTKIASHYGSQAVIASVNVSENDSTVLERAKKAVDMGAGEILLQSIPRDGTMQGYDLSLIESVAKAVSVPVIASGGCSGYEDMADALRSGASAVAAGALFSFTPATPREASQFLAEQGFTVRTA